MMCGFTLYLIYLYPQAIIMGGFFRDDHDGHAGSRKGGNYLAID
jgi:hypothetical protein